MNQEVKILFLHHSTGQIIWDGGIRGTSLSQLLSKISPKLSRYFLKRAFVPSFFEEYNKLHKTIYKIEEMTFPKSEPYGWNNYPFDYYNIWVKNAGDKRYKNEPTLEILTKNYNVIIFKHCFPISQITRDNSFPDINSDEKKIENYILQYNALKQKMLEFPNTKFIIWTPAVCNKNQIDKEQANATKKFRDWLVNIWDSQEDNIYLWDFYNYETEGGLYLMDNYSVSDNDSHPNIEFAKKIAPKLCDFIINVVENEL